MELLYKKERKTATKKDSLQQTHTLFRATNLHQPRTFYTKLFVMCVTLISSVMSLPAERGWVNKNLP